MSSTFSFSRNKQFAVVENPGFWNWTFTLIDEDEQVLAQIDRNWRGIGFEVMSFLSRELSNSVYFLHLEEIHVENSYIDISTILYQ